MKHWRYSEIKSTLCIWMTCHNFNTLRPRQNGVHMQTPFLGTFSWWILFLFSSKFHRHVFSRAQLTMSINGSHNGVAPIRRQANIWTNDGIEIGQYWFRPWLAAKKATVHYLNYYRGHYPKHWWLIFNWTIREIWINTEKMSFKKMHLTISSALFGTQVMTSLLLFKMWLSQDTLYALSKFDFHKNENLGMKCHWLVNIHQSLFDFWASEFRASIH